MNKIFIQFAEIAWSRVLIGGVIALVIYYLVWFNDGKLVQADLTQAKQELSEAQKTLNATKEAMANADSFEREVKETVDQFNRVVPEIMPDKMSTADLTNIASDMTNKAGVKLTKTEPRSAVDKADFYETTRIALSVEGTFSQLVMFLSYLSRIPKLMTFDHLDIGFSDSSANSESPKLTLNGILTGYKYVKPAADGKGRVKGADANAKK
jgi:Tfp pilus assembly protein PilO